MSRLGGSTAPRAAGGSSAAGAMASSSSTAPEGGTLGPGPTAGAWGTRTPTGASGLGATGGTTAPEPNGAATPLGRLFSGTVTPHAHEDAASGGVIDYARLVVAATPPAAPAAPSDAFWLNPGEEA
jgi:hypothetical protein